MDVVSISLPLLVGLIALALLFDFINGLHDAANSIATIVSTRVLRPQVAVAWAAFFNFIAFLFFGLHVAQTLGSGIVTATAIDAAVIFGALMGATLWNVITWAGGIPSSSSHALIGGLVGAGVAKAGFGVVVWRRSRADVARHCPIAPDWVRAGTHPGLRDNLGLSSVVPICRRPRLSKPSVSLGSPLLAWSWRQ